LLQDCPHCNLSESQLDTTDHISWRLYANILEW